MTVGPSWHRPPLRWIKVSISPRSDCRTYPAGHCLSLAFTMRGRNPGKLPPAARGGDDPGPVPVRQGCTAIQNLMKSDTPALPEARPQILIHLTLHRPTPALPVLHGLHVLHREAQTRPFPSSMLRSSPFRSPRRSLGGPTVGPTGSGSRSCVRIGSTVWRTDTTCCLAQARRRTTGTCRPAFPGSRRCRLRPDLLPVPGCSSCPLHSGP